MTNDKFLEKIESALKVYYYNSDELINHAKKLLVVVNAARALKGDLDAADESPTHYSSYFTLTDAINNLEEV
jgi:hypothetical protein